MFGERVYAMHAGVGCVYVGVCRCGVCDSVDRRQV